MSAPGVAPPGVQPANISQANRPSLPSSFQAPPNLPANINLNAPVIRLGTGIMKPQGGSGITRKDSDGPSRPPQTDRELAKQAQREIAALLVPLSKDEIMRTAFVGNLTEGLGGNQNIQRLLFAVGKLRRWDRAVGSDGNDCPFGFAQFDDIESLAVAAEVLPDLEIPTEKQVAGAKPNSLSEGEDAYDDVDKTKLIFNIDPSTKTWLDNFRESKGDEFLSALAVKAKEARQQMAPIVREWFYPPASTDNDGDVKMAETSGQNGEANVEVVSILLAPEDDLSDIPPEIRETVIAEIAAFRERSLKRDLERLRQEEEFEAQERLRNGSGVRLTRLDSSPPPSGAHVGANHIPLAPRGAVPNAPAGPRAQAGSGTGTRSVAFVNGSTNGDSKTAHNGEDDDTDTSDEEIHKRESAKREAEEEKLFLEAERRWVNRERSRAAALEREKARDESELTSERKSRDLMAERLKAWDDDREARGKSELYYRDRSAWIRERAGFRAREQAADDADRRAEMAERAKLDAEREQARGLADSFLERQAKEMQSAAAAKEQAPAPQPFKLSLGAAAQRIQAQRALPQRRTVAEVEGLLEDEEEDATTRRQLVPIKFEPLPPGATEKREPLTEEENQAAVRALAQEIPSDKAGLWGWDVQWDFLDDSVVQDKLRPFVEKKIVDYLGVQEQLLVGVVEEHLSRRGKPGDLVEELSEALDESEEMVMKLWRMLIFFTECERRGLTA